MSVEGWVGRWMAPSVWLDEASSTPPFVLLDESIAEDDGVVDDDVDDKEEEETTGGLGDDSTDIGDGDGAFALEGVAG